MSAERIAEDMITRGPRVARQYLETDVPEDARNDVAAEAVDLCLMSRRKFKERTGYKLWEQRDEFDVTAYSEQYVTECCREYRKIGKPFVPLCLACLAGNWEAYRTCIFENGFFERCKWYSERGLPNTQIKCDIERRVDEMRSPNPFLTPTLSPSENPFLLSPRDSVKIRAPPKSVAPNTTLDDIFGKKE